MIIKIIIFFITFLLVCSIWAFFMIKRAEKTFPKLKKEIYQKAKKNKLITLNRLDNFYNGLWISLIITIILVFLQTIKDLILFQNLFLFLNTITLFLLITIFMIIHKVKEKNNLALKIRELGVYKSWEKAEKYLNEEMKET